MLDYRFLLCVNMCKYIFPALLYSQTSYYSMCTDSFFLEVALFNTQWRLDVLLNISPGMKQKNIIRTWLNGFTAEQILYAVKYTLHCHLMVDVVNKQPVIKILILKLLKTIVMRIWLRSWMWGRCWILWKCLTMTAMVKPSSPIEPFQVSKSNEICFILFFCNCP